MEIPPISVFVGYGCVLLSCRDLRGAHCIWYHCYLLPVSHGLADGITFACGDSIDLGSKKAAVVLERGLYQQEGDSMEMW